MEKVEVGEVFTITDGNNEEQEVEVMAVLALEDTEYVAVSFVEDLKQDSDEDIDLFFMKIDGDGDFSAIESDEEFDKVSSAFEEQMPQEKE